ncbi:N-acetyltransferase family protein [Sphingobium yanoikuyae]
MSVRVRSAKLDDAEAIATIYSHHVLHGTATYEMTPPTPQEMAVKIDSVLAKGWPFIVAAIDDQVIGYAYATQFRDRPAYAFACEDSIYIDADHVGRGIGRTLLNALIDAAEVVGFRTMVAVIGGAEPASVALHLATGFQHAGTLKAMGWKMGRWLDSAYLQLPLGSGAATPPNEGQ